MKTPLIVLCGILALAMLTARAEPLAADACGLVEAERAFALLAKETNTREAFLAYLTDHSITFRNGPHKGKAGILEQPANDSLLEWAPAFVEVAASGDFGYDFGPWTYRNHRADAEPIAWGTFVTIWKKQPDGAWRVVLDLGCHHRPLAESTPAVPATSALKPAKIEAARGGDFRADLLAAERDFLSHFSQGGAAAYGDRLSSEARLYRPGLTPVLTPREISGYFDAQRGAARTAYEFIDGESASSGDLGYVYGWVTTETSTAGKMETKRANYLRIWKREDGRTWKIVLDVISSN